MTKRFLMTAMAVSLGLGVCLAQGPRHSAGPRHRGGEAQFESLKGYLGLSDTQVAALRQARRDAFEQAKPSMKENAERARELRAEMSKANPDRNTVGRLMTEMKQSRQQGQTMWTQVREKSLAVLTEAQKAKLKSLEEAAALESAVREARSSGLIGGDAAEGSPGVRMRGFRPER